MNFLNTVMNLANKRVLRKIFTPGLTFAQMMSYFSINEFKRSQLISFNNSKFKNLKIQYFSLFQIILLTLPAIIFSCTEKYWPKLNPDYERLLVVDGRITNEPVPYTIRLSTSSSIEAGIFKPVTNAKIIISDDVGQSELLTEIDNGIYQTDPNGIKGIIGRKYRISIEYNNKFYESSFEELKAPVDIESISAKWEKHTGNSQDEFGSQFYLTTETSDSAINYFYWEVSETYYYMSTYWIWGLYWGENNNGKSGFEVIQNQDTLKYCWKTNKINELYTYTTKNLTSPKIKNLALNFTPNSEKFRFKYALHVRQFTISENANIFLNVLQEQNEVESSLGITHQPYQLLGNVYSIDNPDEPVLGYFHAAATVSQRTVMVRRPIGYDNPFEDFNCGTLTQSNHRDPYTRIENMTITKWPYIIGFNPYVFYPPTPMIVDIECLDCRFRGGVTIKPDYWDDHSLLIPLKAPLE